MQDGRVYGATDSSAFALDAANGRRVWRHFLVTRTARYVDIAPQVADGDVYLGTIGYPPDGPGRLYALDAGTGRVRWSLSTIKGSWRIPAEAGGGGSWQTPSVAGSDVFWGTANPLPYGGSRSHPNGGAYAGAALYTDSLLDVDAQTGELRWYDQVTPHDVRDYDFQLPPVLGSSGGRQAVFGAGKAGIVIAWNRKTHDRHLADRGRHPSQRPWPAAVTSGLRLPRIARRRPDADGIRRRSPLSSRSSTSACSEAPTATRTWAGSTSPLAVGESSLRSTRATGRQVWARRLPEPDFGCATLADGVVFTSTFDGIVYALDTRTGAVLWRVSMRAGINSCPALASTWLLVGAGVPRDARSVLELTAFTTG